MLRLLLTLGTILELVIPCGEGALKQPMPWVGVTKGLTFTDHGKLLAPSGLGTLAAQLL